MEDRIVRYEDWGHMPYKKAWDRQKDYLKRAVDIKTANRGLPPAEQAPIPNVLAFCEHPPVYTLGKSGEFANLLLSEAQLREQGIAYYHIERGGDITYHGPGQITGYPIWDLESFGADLHRYLRGIEEAIIQVLARYDLKAGRMEGFTGVWLDTESETPRKICAIGIKCSRWVCMHGFAFNVNTDLSYFQNIIPCGINDKAVTSLAAETGRQLDMETVRQQVKSALATEFGFRFAEEDTVELRRLD